MTEQNVFDKLVLLQVFLVTFSLYNYVFLRLFITLSTTLGMSLKLLRGLDGPGHFQIVLISLKRTLYKNKGMYPNSNGEIYRFFLLNNTLWLNKLYLNILSRSKCYKFVNHSASLKSSHCNVICKMK